MVDGRRHRLLMTAQDPIELSFVTCVSNQEVLAKRLLSSPCLRDGKYPLTAYFNAGNAAQAFNATALGLQGPNTWLIWVHQDVYLPFGWDNQFKHGLRTAESLFSGLAVVGVYGVTGAGPTARRAGHVLDRGQLLHEPFTLPCLVDSMDELLFAVRCSSHLELDAGLGWDFYATDMVLQAQELGHQCAVVDALCEHWSDTPTSGLMPSGLMERIDKSAKHFERKWAHRLPITTPCFEIGKPGDVSAALQTLASHRATEPPSA